MTFDLVKHMVKKWHARVNAALTGTVKVIDTVIWVSAVFRVTVAIRDGRVVMVFPYS